MSGNSMNTVGAFVPNVPKQHEPISIRLHQLLDLANTVKLRAEGFEQRFFGNPPKGGTTTAKQVDNTKPYGLPISIDEIESELRATLATIDRFDCAL